MRRGERMKRSLLILIISLLILMSSGCILKNENPPNKENFLEKEIFHYEIQIEYSGNNNYTLILPVPLISRKNNPKKGEPIDLMNELAIVYGEGSYGVSTNEYGYGLEIRSNQSCFIVGDRIFENESTDNDDNYAFDSLSMATSEKYNSSHRIYFSGENNTAKLNISIYYRREHSKGGHNLEWGITNYNLTNGWQEVNMFVEMVEAG